jgi:hypothetical protein
MIVFVALLFGRMKAAFAARLFWKEHVMAKTPSEIRLIARKHARTAAATLVVIMRKKAASPASRVAAANRVLDLALGEPTRPLAGNADSAAPEVTEIVRTIVDPPERRDDPRVVDGRGEPGQTRP